MLCFRCPFEGCLCSFSLNFSFDVAVANMSFLSQNVVFFYMLWLALFWKTTSKRVADDTRKQLENSSKISPKTVQIRSFFATFAAEAVGDDFGMIFGSTLGASGRLLAARKRPGRRP